MRSLGISKRESNLTAPLFCPAMGAASGIPYTEKGPTAAGYPGSKRLIRYGMSAGEEATPALAAEPAGPVGPVDAKSAASGESSNLHLYLGLALAGAAYYYFKVKKG